MTKEVLTKEELFIAIDDCVAEFTRLTSALDEAGINKVPYADSWTAGQLLRHVTKAINGMAGAMLAEGKPAGRDTTEKVHHLRKTFLDFSQKMQSPDFILPEDEVYQVQTAIDDLEQSNKKLKENTNKADLDGLLDGLPFGPTTKLELLHFVLYHTERHLHQMRRICEALHNG